MTGKEKQTEKTQERQSLYTLTPDHPPLRAEYFNNDVDQDDYDDAEDDGDDDDDDADHADY